MMNAENAAGGPTPDEILLAIRGIREQLIIHGGPPVSRAVLHAYLADALTPEERAKAEQRISRWRNWFDECWQLWLEMNTISDNRSVSFQNQVVAKNVIRIPMWRRAPMAAAAAIIAIVVGTWFTIDHIQQSGDLRLTLALKDKQGLIGLDSHKNLHGLAASDDLQHSITSVLVAQAFQKPIVLAGVVGEQGVPRGPSREGLPFALDYPVGIVVPTEKPTFRWQPLGKANQYEVTIVGPAGKRFTSGRVSETKWTPDESQQLRRGEVYEWQVTAYAAGTRLDSSPKSPAPEARFKVIDEPSLHKLQAAIAASGDSHLARTVLYQHAGMLDEAEAELLRLLELNKDSPEAEAVIEHLLDSLRKERRQP